MRNAQFKRQPDGSIVVSLRTKTGPCTLFVMLPGMMMENHVSCPAVYGPHMLQFILTACDMVLHAAAKEPK
jgi:hypothetical protein